MGVTPGFAELHSVHPRTGRFITDLDHQRGLAVAVLSESVAKKLFPLDEPLGQSIRIGIDHYYRIVGVVSGAASSSSQGDAGGMEQEGFEHVVFIPLNSDRKRFGDNITFDPSEKQLPEVVEISELTVTLASTEQVLPAARLIQSILAERRKDQEVTLVVPLELQAKAEQTQRLFTVVLTSIASISLLVGGIGIMNIMLATVTERTREIGIRRALGARRTDIVSQFLVEAMVLSGIGGILGVLLGFMGARFVESLGGQPTIVQPSSPIIAVTISLLVGLVFGIYPARHAAMMNPIQALRHE